MVYLIHFERPYKHARHYIGFCDHDLDNRIHQHQNGTGSRLLRAVNQAGIKWEVVRVWPDGDRNFERHKKNQRNTSHFCPACQAERKKLKKGVAI